MSLDRILSTNQINGQSEEFSLEAATGVRDLKLGALNLRPGDVGSDAGGGAALGSLIGMCACVHEWMNG